MKINPSLQVDIARMTPIQINFALKILIENKLETWSYDDFFSEIQRDDSIVLIGESNNKIIGFCVARLIRQNDYTPTNLNYQNYNECEIYNIAVKKEYQGIGVGKQILDKLILLAKVQHSQSIWLEVRNSNYKAINFYRNNHFKQMYKRKNFYSNPSEDAVVMKKDLQ